MEPVYLDHNATSPASKAHLEAVLLAASSAQGNPSSPHALGRRTHVELTLARRRVAQALGWDAGEIIFCSGGSEANNLGTAGVLRAVAQGAWHAVMSAIEHPSVSEALRAAAQAHPAQAELGSVPCDANGFVSAVELVRALRPQTLLVTLMAANNEVGTLQPVRLFGNWLHARRFGRAEDAPRGEREARLFAELDAALDPQVGPTVLQRLHFHVDGVQAFGKVRRDLWMARGIDSIAICGHKLGGLSGAGAVALRRGRKFAPLVLGGAQERSRRAGTENVFGIVSLGLVAEEIAGSAWWDSIREMEARCSRFRQELRKFPELQWNSPSEEVLPNTINASLSQEGMRGEDLLVELDLRGICASSGSACSSGANLPSKVLLAMGRSEAVAKNALRISIGRFTTDREVAYTTGVLAEFFRRASDTRR